jgi:hypothetical protein
MADYRDAFGIFDLDSDGLISAKELKTMMERLGNPINDREVRDIITEAGSLSTNSITQVRRLSEFRRLLEALGGRCVPRPRVTRESTTARRRAATQNPALQRRSAHLLRPSIRSRLPSPMPHPPCPPPPPLFFFHRPSLPN